MCAAVDMRLPQRNRSKHMLKRLITLLPVLLMGSLLLSACGAAGQAQDKVNLAPAATRS